VRVQGSVHVSLTFVIFIHDYRDTMKKQVPMIDKMLTLFNLTGDVIKNTF
jgi:hypothetical protein